MGKDNDTKKGVHCGACKLFVTNWVEHCKTEEHKRHAAVIQPAIDRVLSGSASSVEEAMMGQGELKAELDAAKKRIEQSLKDLKLKVEEKE